jgi:hypothetical protein
MGFHLEAANGNSIIEQDHLAFWKKMKSNIPYELLESTNGKLIITGLLLVAF